VKLIVVGALLVGLSLYPIFRFASELLRLRRVDETYQLTKIETSTVAFDSGQKITVSDKFYGTYSTDTEVQRGPVSIVVNGKEYGISSEVEIQRARSEQSRYINWVSLFRVLDREANETYIAVIQRIGVPPAKNITDLRTLRFRILRIRVNGQVSEEVFSYAERNYPYYRGHLVSSVVPIIELWWPNVFVPFLYPITSTVLGMILVLAGWYHKRNYATAN
jgi:hypothetical protein